MFCVFNIFPKILHLTSTIKHFIFLYKWQYCIVLKKINVI
jgi:ABC-type transport system involved in Fe-S cluster assembly fused permease/ATPase subunit